MLPWVYEFHWTPFHIIFLSVFFTVFMVVAATLMTALRRTAKAHATGAAEAILWHSDFEDLAPAARSCRHQFTGDVAHRQCDHAFDCRTCPLHRTFPPLEGRGVSPLTLQEDVLGFAMPADRMYHRGHTWVAPDNEGNYLVGLDDFGKRIIGTADAKELPPVGSRVTVNGTGWKVRTHKAALRILSPVDGEVTAHGGAEDAWTLKVRPAENGNGTEHLLRGAEVRPWIMREMERLQVSFATAGVGATLADGGELVPDFHRHFPKADWDGVLGQMFLEA